MIQSSGLKFDLPVATDNNLVTKFYLSEKLRAKSEKLSIRQAQVFDSEAQTRGDPERAEG